MITYHRFASLDAATPDNMFAPVHIKHLKTVVSCGSIVISVMTREDSLSFNALAAKVIGQILAVAHQLDNIPSSERSNMSHDDVTLDKAVVKLHMCKRLDEAWYTWKRRPVPEAASSLYYCWVPAGFIVELAFCVHSGSRQSFVCHNSGHEPSINDQIYRGRRRVGVLSFVP